MGLDMGWDMEKGLQNPFSLFGSIFLGGSPGGVGCGFFAGLHRGIVDAEGCDLRLSGDGAEGEDMFASGDSLDDGAGAGLCGKAIRREPFHAEGDLGIRFERLLEDVFAILKIPVRGIDDDSAGF